MSCYPRATSYLLLLFSSSFITCIHGYASGIYDCPAPWIGFAENCFKFVLFPVRIDVAKAECAVDGSALVSVHTREENDFIVGWLTRNAKQGLEFFTGGVRDQRTSGSGGSTGVSSTYYWESDGSPVAGLQFWFSDSARNNTGNRIVYYTDGSKWGWALFDDTRVDGARPYICEISKANIYLIVNYDRGFDFGVAEIDQTQLPRGPVFTLQPLDTVFDPASSIRYIMFDCEADGNPVPSYSWTVYNNLLLQPVNVSDQAITITNGKLVITEPRDSVHSGDYQCTAMNPLGSIMSTVVQLSFGYLNDFPKSRRDPVRATAFTGVGIECYPPKSGYTSLSYAWYKDTPKNFIRPNVKWYIFVSSDSKLYFQSVTKDDDGFYFCIVTRPNSLDNFQEGKVSMPIPLSVIETVGSEQEPQIVNSFPKAFPSSPQVGNNVRLECVAWGTDILKYSWNRTDAPLSSNANFSDYNRVLTLPNVQLKQAGKYRCNVDRRLGQSTWGELTLSVESKPYFTIPLPNKQMDQGSDVYWICMADGVPSVSYTWYINATLFSKIKMIPSDASRFSVSDNRLTILNVQPQDAGMYQCEARNTHGNWLSSAQLRVLSFAPSFVKFPLQPNLYGTILGNVTLVCNPESAPSSKKEWNFNGQALQASTDPSQRIWLIPNGNLHISQLSMSDAGNYTCIATNPLGTASSSGALTILPTTAISQPPRDLTVLVNSTAFFHCGASYNPALDITYEWYHNNYNIMFIKIRNLGNSVVVFKEPHYYRGIGVNRGGLYINQTQFYHRGVYRCVAMTTSEQTEAEAILNVNGPPGQPAGIMGSNPQVTNLTLTWWPSVDNGKPVLRYIVQGFSSLSPNWVTYLKEVPTSNDPLAKLTAVVPGLNPYTNYKFRVIGVNSYGHGLPSQESMYYKTLPAPPIVYPQNVGGGGGKVGTLEIRWNPIPMKEWNADPGTAGYVVYWKKHEMDKDSWDNKIIYQADANHYTVTIGATNFYRPYDVCVEVFNPSGKGPLSPIVTIMSAEDMPKGVPISVKAVYFNSTAITVEWKPVDNTVAVMRGVLLGYRINYWVDILEDEQQALYKIIRNQTGTGRIIALNPNTYYQINVQAINTAGNGPKSENYRTRTLRHSPIEAPQDVRVAVVDHSSILVKWRGVYTTIIEEPLQGYVVRYWKRGENLRYGTNVDAGKAIQFHLQDLKQNIQYEMRVFGVSRGGDGLQSSPTTEFILGTGCQVTQDSPDKEYIYYCPGNPNDHIGGSSHLQSVSLLVLIFLGILSLLIGRRTELLS